MPKRPGKDVDAGEYHLLEENPWSVIQYGLFPVFPEFGASPTAPLRCSRPLDLPDCLPAGRKDVLGRLSLPGFQVDQGFKCSQLHVQTLGVYFLAAADKFQA